MPGVDSGDLEAAIVRLHDAPQMVYLACTGAGAGLTRLLWSVAGCSRTLIGSEFPYDGRAFANLIGRTPAQYSSRDAAIALATAAYLKGQQCLVEQGRLTTPIVGLGLTAAVATDRTRRGEDRVYLAIRTAGGLATVSAVFQRDALTRAEEGDLCDLLALNCLLWAAGLEQIPLATTAHVAASEITAAGAVEPAAVRISLDDAASPLFLDADGNRLDPSVLSPATHVLFPGSFNPLHYGHDSYARTVAAMSGKQVVFELAVANADKPGIDRDALAARALQFRGRWPVLLSEHLPLFIHKARRYGGFSFILGLDTAIRLIDPRYFDSPQHRDIVLDEFRTLGVTFYVCNRGDDPLALARAVEDPLVAGLFIPVPMLVPVSSTQLRGAEPDRGG